MINIIAIVFIVAMMAHTLTMRPPVWIVVIQAAMICINVPFAVTYLSSL